MRGRPKSKAYKRDPEAYDRKTRHLGLLEHGAYNLLLDYYYKTGGPLPRTKLALYRICRAIYEHEKRAVDAVVSEFFTLAADGWHNARADEEIINKTKAWAKRESYYANSKTKKSADKIDEKTPDNSAADAARPHEDSPAQSEPDSGLISAPFKEKEPPTGSPKRKFPETSRGTRLPDDFAIPDDWRDWAKREGQNYLIHDPPRFADEQGARFLDHWRGAAGSRGVKRDWAATYRNWIREAISRDRSGARRPASASAAGADKYQAAHAAIDEALGRPVGAGRPRRVDDPRPASARDNAGPVEPGDLFGRGPPDTGER